MTFDRKHLLLYAVTDRSWTGEKTLREQVESALKGGVTCVQLREKKQDPAAFLAEAKEIGALCRRFKVPFLINDNVEIALACGADGVHVGQNDMPVSLARQKLGPDKIIGVSAHSVREALDAVRDGADYLGAGAVFSTSTKTDTSVLSLETLRAICDAVPVPVVAIGGIHESNILKLSGSHAAGAALVSAIFAAGDIEQACRRLRALAEQMVSDIGERVLSEQTAPDRTERRTDL